MKIFIIAGKARNGKDTVAQMIRDYYKENSINLSYGSYIKEYAKKISGWDGKEETKPRQLLQTLGTEIIRKNIDDDFFIKRICDDIRVYQNYFDIITISDARFPKEIEIPKSLFKNVYVIKVERSNFESPLTEKQKLHSTETALDNFDKYDFIIKNDSTIENLYEKVKTILKEVK